MDSINMRQPLRSLSNVVAPDNSGVNKLADAQNEDDILSLFYGASLDPATVENLRSDFRDALPFFSDDSWIPEELRLPDTASPSSVSDSVVPDACSGTEVVQSGTTVTLLHNVEATTDEPGSSASSTSSGQRWLHNSHAEPASLTKTLPQDDLTSPLPAEHHAYTGEVVTPEPLYAPVDFTSAASGSRRPIAYDNTITNETNPYTQFYPPARHMVPLVMPHPSALSLPEPVLLAPSRDLFGTLPILADCHLIPPCSTRSPFTSSGPALQGPPLDGLYDVLPSIGKRKRGPGATRRARHAPHPIPHIPELAHWPQNFPGTNAGPSQITFIHEPSSAAADNTPNVPLPVSNNQYVCLFPKRNQHGVEVACLASLTRENYSAHFSMHYKALGYNARKAVAKRTGKQDIDVPCPWCITERLPSGRRMYKSKELTKHVRDVHFALNQKTCAVCLGGINRSNEPKARWRHERTKMHKDGLLTYRMRGGVEPQDGI